MDVICVSSHVTNFVYELPQKLSNNLRLKKLENKKRERKSRYWVKRQGSAQLSPNLETSFSKNLFLATAAKTYAKADIKVFLFFFYLGFLSQTFTIHETAGEGEGIYLTPLYHFHLLHRHLDISRAITAESSPLHIVGSRTRTGNLWFPSATR